jgi:hypothetical protein
MYGQDDEELLTFVTRETPSQLNYIVSFFLYDQNIGRYIIYNIQMSNGDLFFDLRHLDLT